MVAHLTLDKVDIGEAYHIKAFQDATPIKSQFLALGLMPGAKITLVRKAPMGDPLEIECRGMHVMLRHQEASYIILESECLT